MANALTGTSPTSQPLIHPWQRHFPPPGTVSRGPSLYPCKHQAFGTPLIQLPFPALSLLNSHHMLFFFFFKFIWVCQFLVVTGSFVVACDLFIVACGTYFLAQRLNPDPWHWEQSLSYRTTKEVSHHMLYILSFLFH